MKKILAFLGILSLLAAILLIVSAQQSAATALPIGRPHPGHTHSSHPVTGSPTSTIVPSPTESSSSDPTPTDIPTVTPTPTEDSPTPSVTPTPNPTVTSPDPTPTTTTPAPTITAPSSTTTTTSAPGHKDVTVFWVTSFVQAAPGVTPVPDIPGTYSGAPYDVNSIGWPQTFMDSTPPCGAIIQADVWNVTEDGHSTEAQKLILNGTLDKPDSGSNFTDSGSRPDGSPSVFESSEFIVQPACVQTSTTPPPSSTPPTSTLPTTSSTSVVPSTPASSVTPTVPKTTHVTPSTGLSPTHSSPKLGRAFLLPAISIKATESPQKNNPTLITPVALANTGTDTKLGIVLGIVAIFCGIGILVLASDKRKRNH